MDGIKKKRRLSSSRIIILGFALVIAIGTVCLLLPFASVTGHSVGFVNALFTATSATCVTGMTVIDTTASWTVFGKCVIFLLMQIGGMGVVTFAVIISMLAGKKIGLLQRTTMAETAASTSVGGMVRLAGFVAKVTIACELAGALLFTPVFAKDYGIIKGFGYGLFHSVSSFCNAGFDICGGLDKYGNDLYFNAIIIALVVIGGIGFLVWDDIRDNLLNIKRYKMQTKIVLFVTGFLMLVSFIFFYCGEYNRDVFDGMSRGEKALRAMFQTVAMRSVGFVETDPNLYSEPGQFLMIIFMMIGGSPGSTAGGMKTTTVAVLIAACITVFSRREDVTFFGRRIHDDVIKYASTIFMLYFGFCITGGILICVIEGLPLFTCMFEAAAAVSTAGISLGITSSLSLASRIIIIILMFIGRAGGLTIVFAALAGEKKSFSRLPMEKLTVG